ncbi:MAG: hypothetical protein LAT65_14455 [Saccharospirillum sp.]|nr:hypothetical protein [Saccharospirillum sp.]
MDTATLPETLAIAIAMILGVFASSVLHLSQGLMRMGLMNLRINPQDRRARWRYIAGLLMNFTAPLWVMLANLFAPIIWFTSMFATGLVALLVFSRSVLKEPLSSWQVAGAALILLATAALAASLRGDMAGSESDIQTLVVATLIWVMAAPLVGWALKRNRLSLQELFFGALAGGFLALDALWKRLAQTSATGEVNLLPEDPSGWLLLLSSFTGAGGAFLMMQWAYLRQCRASAVVISYNVMYVLLPLGLTLIVSGTEALSVATVVAVMLLLVGAAMTANRPAAEAARMAQ